MLVLGHYEFLPFFSSLGKLGTTLALSPFFSTLPLPGHKTAKKTYHTLICLYTLFSAIYLIVNQGAIVVMETFGAFWLLSY